MSSRVLPFDSHIVNVREDGVSPPLAPISSRIFALYDGDPRVQRRLIKVSIATFGVLCLAGYYIINPPPFLNNEGVQTLTGVIIAVGILNTACFFSVCLHRNRGLELIV